MSGWLRGIVKEVLSGDTLVIVPASKGPAPPPEKRLSLSSLVAPRLGRRDGSTVDEPFAWQSREFLRRLAIGKACVFRVDYKLEQAGDREFGSVFFGEQNVSLSIVTAGWAKVRESGSQQSPFYENLLEGQEQAKIKKLGVHNNEEAAISASIRSAAEEDSSQLLKRHGKGGQVKAIVEGIMSGSMMRVTLTDSLKTLVVMVTGIVCPAMKSNVAGTEGPEAFAREAKWLSESACLNRDVTLVMDGVSQHGALIASIKYPTGNGDADLAEVLMAAGLAKGAEWSLNMINSGSFKLREAERAARVARKGIWHDHVAQPSNFQNQNKFRGRVVEVVSGDCVVICDETTGVERRLTLASVRAPRAPNRDRAGEPFGAEAKEFLRGRLIGQTVSVEMEYSKKISIGQSASNPKPEERSVDFGTVNLLSKGAEKDEKQINVAELLLIRGLASTVRHRVDDERSAYFESLFNAEESGKKGRKGIHSGKEAPITRVNDLSAPGSASKARQHLPFLQRAGAISAVVEFVMSGSRLKLYVPKQSVSIAFSPSGVKCPAKGDEFSGDALAFTKSNFMQRNVVLKIENVDKLGTFLGTIVLADGVQASQTSQNKNKVDLGVALLENGLAKLHEMSNVSVLENGRELLDAEEKARMGKLGIWSKEEKVVPKTDGPVQQFKREKTRVVITEMIDANSFYIQYADEARPQWIADQLKELTPELDGSPSSQAATGSYRSGALVLAKFEPDKQWYRAKITKVYANDPINPKYDVFFIDFGNRDSGLSTSSVRPMPQTLAAVPAQAHLATLAFVRAPVEIRDDLGFIVMDRVASLTHSGSIVLEGYKESMSRTEEGVTVLHLTLFPGAASEDVSCSINGELAMDGLVKCSKEPPRDPQSRSLFVTLQDLERDARRRHLGIFEFGDVSDDEDEDAYPILR
jgi:staphylococcal nuclease domain-containing protein 1